MNRIFETRTPLIIALLLFATPGNTASEFTVLDGDLSDFKSAFNADTGKLRLVMYVSPTCGGCLRGAQQTQENLLAAIDSSELAAYVIWAPKNGGRESHVERVLHLVTDARATQYWDGSGAAVDAYDAMFGIEGRPCAGVFMLYPADAVWAGDSPPMPEYFEDAHAREFKRTAGSQYDSRRLAKQARQLLDEKT
jgi:hypothetical protein